MEFVYSEQPRYISCYLMGGLGNQLFQIFATIAYGLQNERQVVFPHSKQLTSGTVRNTYWDSFLNVIEQTHTVANTNNHHTNDSVLRFPTVKENGFRYIPVPNVHNPEFLLYGYYQSYKYFQEVQADLFQLIQLDKQKDTIVQKTSDDYFSNGEIKNISMHFRIGDYKKIQDCHPLMTYEYYEKALKYIIEKDRTSQHQVLYFHEDIDTDDVNMIIYQLTQQDMFSSIQFVRVQHSLQDWEQMLLMSCCSHNIIANSTFSWWGAYFNTCADKIVCYPSLWFGPKIGHDTQDLFPEDWNRIIM